MNYFEKRFGSSYKPRSGIKMTCGSMKIAIQAADLDAERIDGTRVYIWQLLNRFGTLSTEDDFFIYHRKVFNPELIPENFDNYHIKAGDFPVLWTQTWFSYELWKDKIDTLWMPMQAMPVIRKPGLRTVITMHDLAFKIFPKSFPRGDLRRLNLLTDYAVHKSDKIIAVSENTKKDILHFYPDIAEEKIQVVHHGFNTSFVQKEYDSVDFGILQKLQIQKQKYFLYVGALQPRKNLVTLIDAFTIFKNTSQDTDMKLVLVGERAWLWEGILEAIENSPCREDIVLPGKVPFAQLQLLYNQTLGFVFPSLYEGFGIPVLEAFASKVPVIASQNSSLPEVGGGAALYFDALSAEDLSVQLTKVHNFSPKERVKWIENGQEQLKKFSWDKCAQETLRILKE